MILPPAAAAARPQQQLPRPRPLLQPLALTKVEGVTIETPSVVVPNLNFALDTPGAEKASNNIMEEADAPAVSGYLRPKNCGADVFYISESNDEDVNISY
jgi:hypothetical protein